MYNTGYEADQSVQLLYQPQQEAPAVHIDLGAC